MTVHVTGQVVVTKVVVMVTGGGVSTLVVNGVELAGGGWGVSVSHGVEVGEGGGGE